MQLIQATPGLAHQRFTTLLDSVPVVLALRWNATGAFWTLTVEDTEGVTITTLQLRLGLCGLTVRDPRLPAGCFFLLDTASGDVEPGLTDLGGRVQLRWLPIAEATQTDESDPIRTSAPTLVGGV